MRLAPPSYLNALVMVTLLVKWLIIASLIASALTPKPLRGRVEDIASVLAGVYIVLALAANTWDRFNRRRVRKTMGQRPT